MKKLKVMFIVVLVSAEPITKDEFVGYCYFNALVLDSNYDLNEVIEKTVASYALAQEAIQREISLPNGENYIKEQL